MVPACCAGTQMARMFVSRCNRLLQCGTECPPALLHMAQMQQLLWRGRIVLMVVLGPAKQQILVQHVDSLLLVRHGARANHR